MDGGSFVWGVKIEKANLDVYRRNPGDQFERIASIEGYLGMFSWLKCDGGGEVLVETYKGRNHYLFRIVDGKFHLVSKERSKPGEPDINKNHPFIRAEFDSNGNLTRLFR